MSWVLINGPDSALEESHPRYGCGLACRIRVWFLVELFAGIVFIMQVTLYCILRFGKLQWRYSGQPQSILQHTIFGFTIGYDVWQGLWCLIWNSEVAHKSRKAELEGYEQFPGGHKLTPALMNTMAPCNSCIDWRKVLTCNMDSGGGRGGRAIADESHGRSVEEICEEPPRRRSSREARAPSLRSEAMALLTYRPTEREEADIRAVFEAGHTRPVARHEDWHELPVPPFGPPITNYVWMLRSDGTLTSAYRDYLLPRRR